jgi:hypothetical protein
MQAAFGYYCWSDWSGTVGRLGRSGLGSSDDHLNSDPEISGMVTPRCATLAYETNAPKPFHRNSIGYLQSSQAHHAVFFGVMPDNQISAS